MASPPLPDNPTLRVALKYTQSDGLAGGQRLFFNYTGSAPTSAQISALATYIGGTDWQDELGGAVNEDWTLVEVDIIDITTDSGNAGSWTGEKAGTRSGTPMPAQTAANIEFDVPLRYRGGKPRTYLPPGVTTDMANPSTFASGYYDLVTSGFTSFIAGIVATGIHTADDLTHVNLSYYKGYNTSTPPWRGPGYKYPPRYRDTAVSTPITAYNCKSEIGTQKRRRTATSA